MIFGCKNKRIFWEKNKLIFIFWLVFFLAPCLMFALFRLPFDIGWVVVYFIFVYPVLIIVCFFLDKLLVNKQSTLKENVIKYLLLLVVSCLILWILFYFGFRIDYL